MTQRDIKSRYILEFDTKNADKVQKRLDEMRESLGGRRGGASNAMSNMDQSAGRLSRQFAGLSRHIKDMAKSLQTLVRDLERVRGGVGGGAPGAGAGGGGSGGSGGGAGGGGGGGGPTPPPGAGAGTWGGARGSFSQGLLQGVGFGPYLQRGPGMWRQAGGMALGRFGAGMGGSMFNGMQGLAMAANSLPGGGVVGGALMNAASMAGSNLQEQAALQGLGGLDTFSLGERRRAARIRAGRQGRIDAAAAAAGRRADQLNERDLDAAMEREGRPGWWSRNMFGEENARIMQRGRLRREGGYGSRRESMMEEARRRAAAAERPVNMTDPLTQFQSAARNNSLMTRTQAMQFATQAGLSTIDGSFQAAGNEFGSMFAANTAGYGNAQSLGGILRGQRRGGIEGGPSIARVLTDAMAAGFDRSESNQFLSILAAGQKKWEATGIPINAETITETSRGMAGVFGSGARSMNVAMGFNNMGQRIATQGARSGADMLALQVFGGFSGGGVDDYSKAMERLETGEGITADNIRRLVEMSRGGGSEMGQRESVRGILQAQGVSISRREAGRLVRGDDDLATGIEDRARTEREAQRRLEAVGGASRRGAGGLGRRRDLDDRSSAIGGRMLNTVLKFEESAKNMASGVSKFNGVFEKIADVSEKLTSILDRLPNATANNPGAGAR